MRLFTAIALPTQAQEVLGTVANALARQAIEGHPVPRENLHLTLAFIGETARVNEALEATKKAQQRALAEPFALEIAGVGSFERRGGNSWWAGLEPSKPLMALARAVREELTQAGFKLENRSYKPHITLARGVQAATPLTLNYEPLAVWVTHLTLYKSNLSGQGPHYTALS